MIFPGIPVNEKDRLNALLRYGILDTPPEECFDRLTCDAANILQTPVALVSLIDGTRQWFKSHHGLRATETPREFSFCAHLVLKRGVLEVADATRDPLFFDNPLVVGPPYVKFYVGAPLVTWDGHVLGSLCCIDHVPRSVSPAKIEALQELARRVMRQLELRRVFSPICVANDDTPSAPPTYA